MEKCKQSEIGTYECAIIFKAPFWLYECGWKNSVAVDRCLVDEILNLWRLGVTTYGSCCGHKESHPMINVARKDKEYMKKLGYWEIPNKFNSLTFKPKTAMRGRRDK